MIEQTFHWKHAVSRLQALRKDRRAVVAVITALVFPVLLAFAALALDVGMMQDLKRRQKNAAIAAALTAGHELWLVNTIPNAKLIAKEDAARNNFDDANGSTTVTVNIPPLGGNYAGVANHAEVIIETEAPTYFARVLGANDVTVRSRAVTGLVKHADACVIALEPIQPRAMVIGGGSSLNAQCGVQVNSRNPNDALFLAGSQECLTSPTFIGVTGGIQGAGGSPCVQPTPVQAPPVNDPLYYMHAIAPSYNGTCDYAAQTHNNGDPDRTFFPGTYCSIGTQQVTYTNPDTGFSRVVVVPIPSIRITGGNVTFAPGVYTLASGMSISGSANVTGSEVTFYNTTAGNPSLRRFWGEFTVTGTPNVTLSAPTSGPYEGMLFWEDERAPDRRPSHNISGDATLDLGGALYFKETLLTWGGNTSGADWTMIVADKIRTVGAAVVHADPDWNSGAITPPVRKVTLLE